MSDEWLDIRYRDFHDLPRAIVVRFGDSLYLLDCQFDFESDDYEPNYSVYLLPDELSPYLESMSWVDLNHRGEYIGSIPTTEVNFDPSRRRSINAAALRQLTRGSC